MTREELLTVQELLFKLARIMNGDVVIDRMTAHSTVAVMLYVNKLLKETDGGVKVVQE